jgi:hypothetical protein
MGEVENEAYIEDEKYELCVNRLQTVSWRRSGRRRVHTGKAMLYRHPLPDVLPF